MKNRKLEMSEVIAIIKNNPNWLFCGELNKFKKIESIFLNRNFVCRDHYIYLFELFSRIKNRTHSRDLHRSFRQISLHKRV